MRPYLTQCALLICTQEFDVQLRAMNSEWGVRDLDALASEARTFNIELARTFEMPANNLVVVFRKS